MAATDEEDLTLATLGWMLLGKRKKEERKPQVYKPPKTKPWERHGKRGGDVREASLLLEDSFYYLLEDGSSTILLE